MEQKFRKNKKVINKYINQFYDIYYTNVAPIFATFEPERKKKLFKLICCELLIVVVFAFLITCMGFGFRTFGFFAKVFTLLYIFFIAPVLLVVLPFIFNYYFSQNLKNTCMQNIVETFYDMRWYDRYKMISDDEVRGSKLFRQYDYRFSYDAFEGIYKDVPFRIEETIMHYGLGKYPLEIFRGVIIKFQANKNIRNTTIIATRNENIINTTFFATKNEENILNNKITERATLILLCFPFLYILLCCWFGTDVITNIIKFIIVCIEVAFLAMMFYFNKVEKDIYKNIGVLKKTKLEDSDEDSEFKLFCNNNGLKIRVLSEMMFEDAEFNKKYKAYSDDRIDGRYLVTQAFIEEFNNLQTAFGTNRVKCSFYGDEIMFAISTNKNLFEIGNLFHSLNNPKQMKTFFNELSSILALVDYFKLDEEQTNSD